MSLLQTEVDEKKSTSSGFLSHLLTTKRDSSPLFIVCRRGQYLYPSIMGCTFLHNRMFIRTPAQESFEPKLAYGDAVSGSSFSFALEYALRLCVKFRDQVRR